MQDILSIPVSPGELQDKITILQIKATNIRNPSKHKNVLAELELLENISRQQLPDSNELRQLTARLKDINNQLWILEDDIRKREDREDFGDAFIQLARSIYLTNDDRAAAKRDINILLNSEIVEEKSYAPYRIATVDIASI